MDDSTTHTTGDDTLVQENEQLIAEVDRLKDLAARAQADLQNAKGRMEREAADLRMYAVESMIMKLLPTIDNLQRAFTHLPEDLASHEWVKGVLAVEQQLMNELSAVGLTRMESVGMPVDPNRHEVLQTAQGDKDVVVEVLEEGYLLHEKVLRPAKVIAGEG